MGDNKFYMNTMENKNLKLLKILSLIGGVYEIIFGVLMIFFIVPLLNMMGLNIIELDIPMFSHTAGLLAIIIGLILLFSSQNVEKFLLNIVLITILRFAIQVVIYVNIFLIPTIAMGLFMFALIDLVFAIITIYLIKMSGLSFNLFKLIK